VNNFWLIPVAAYLFGSIPFGLLIVKATAGTDIREKGSGNIGAANVARNAGLVAGALTLLFDAAKGFFAVWLAGYFTQGNIRWMAVAAVSAVIGHMFPIWLKFHGGKGVATGLGVFIPICWHAVVAGIVLWLLVVIFWRYSSLGSIIAAAVMPVFVYFLYAPGHAPPDIVNVSTALVAVLIIIKHRSNIQRLIAGEETRLKFRS
jgi:acyl phosphate:glycerol-3-phosphate acyltransferase